MRRVVVGVSAFALVLAMHGVAAADTYYIGAFAGSSPQDSPGCGLGKGSAPNPHPCATLAYWTSQRRQVLSPGDVVRMTGTLSSCGPVSCANQCIVAQKGVTYEGRTASDGVSDSYTDAIIDGSNNNTGNLSNPCQGLTVMGERQDYTDFTLRDMTLRNAQRSANSFAGVRFDPGGCTGAGGKCSGPTGAAFTKRDQGLPLGRLEPRQQLA